MNAAVAFVALLTLLSTDEDARPVYQAPLAPQAPVMDGVFDDECWRTAPVLSGLVTNKERTPSRFRTEFRLVYDRDALYVAVLAGEPRVDRVEARRNDSESAWWQDNVEIFLDPGATRARYFQYIITPAAVIESGYSGDFAADIAAEAVAGRQADAWTLEVRLPFSALGGTPALGDRWGLNVTRSRNPKESDEERETTLWSTTDGNHGAPGRFGYLLFAAVPGSRPPLATPDRTIIDRVVNRIAEEQHGNWRWTDADAPFEIRIQRGERLIRLLGILGRFPDTRGLVYVRTAIRDDQVLPWTVPLPDEIGTPVQLVACRGEYETASVSVFAATDLEDVLFSVSDLVSGAGAVIPSSAADMHHVICWYQSGTGSVFRSRTTLLAELLMKNPSLVETDPRRRENILHFHPIPRDATTLQPICIPAFESRQCWMTIHVPQNATPGHYTGTLRVADRQGEIAAVPVRLRVPAWDLAPSPMIHGLYFGHRLPKLETVEEENAWFTMFEAEVRHQLEHGCNTIATYMGLSPLPSNPSPYASGERLAAILKEYGISGMPYISIVNQIGFQQGEALRQLTEDARRLSAWAKSLGFDNFYFHGMDEASGERLRREKDAFQAVRDGGAGVFVACRPSFFDIVGPLLNLPNVTGRLHPDLARRVHEAGIRITSYGNPQAGVEQPNVYRRNYGLALRAAGYDGSINYEYRTIDNENAWNDYNESSYRDHNFAYPAEGRPVGTIQFVGWREAVDDIRYAATLQATIAAARHEGRDVAFVDQSETWLSSLSGYEDLDAVRTEMIARIDRLQSQP